MKCANCNKDGIIGQTLLMHQNGYIKSQTYRAYKPTGKYPKDDDGMVGAHAMPKYDALCADCTKKMPIDKGKDNAPF